MKILDYIPEGRENAITRSDLARLTGLPDRVNRRLIEKERQKGEPILASEQGGYYITYDIAEIEAFLRTIDARERSLYHTYEPLRQMVRLKRGIRVTKVREHVRRVGKLKPSEGQLKMGEVG